MRWRESLDSGTWSDIRSRKLNELKGLTTHIAKDSETWLGDIKFKVVQRPSFLPIHLIQFQGLNRKL